MASKGALSDWQIDELQALRRAGWSTTSLAAIYGVTERSINRILRRIAAGKPRKGDLRPAASEIE